MLVNIVLCVVQYTKEVHAHIATQKTLTDITDKLDRLKKSEFLLVFLELLLPVCVSFVSKTH